jgi:nucleoside 2-deoxyribosyltransferase
MDGPDPDSGTAWEVGYAYGKKPVLLVRTDFRSQTGSGTPHNAMLSQSATIRLELPFAPMSRVVAEIVDALRHLEDGSR